MNSLRKWLYRPKKSDTSLLAHFYFADEDLNMVAAELDSFDGRKDPERCTMLVNQLRLCQDKVLGVIQKIMDDTIAAQRANRDFRVKFPDDVLQEGLAGQLWFGAECLASGSSILNREVESASMRPLARALTKNLDSLRGVLRDQCLRSVTEYNDRINEALIIFDKLFAEFELSYVSAMVPVKTMKEYDMLQEVTVLFSETVQRALKIQLLTQDMLDDYDPALMFTIPRLAIVCGLLVYPEGPLNPDMEPTNMTEMFRPFQTLLYKIRELLYTLSAPELTMLEKALCSSQEPEVSTPSNPGGAQVDSLLQIDQGFDEGGEGIVSMDGLGSSILVHTPGSGSPVTPVNSHPDIGDLDQVSPTTTLVANDFRFSSEAAFNGLEIDQTFSGLNKSESQDSGLQSENVSTSDTVTVDCPPLCTQEGEVTPACKLTNSEDSVSKMDLPVSVSESALRTDDESASTDSCSHTMQTESDGSVPIKSNCECDNVCVKSCCRLDSDSCFKELCKEIVEELLVSVVTGARDDYSNCDRNKSSTAPASVADSTLSEEPCDTNSSVNKDDADGESNNAGDNSGVEGGNPGVEGGHPDVKGGHPGVEGGNHGVEGDHPDVDGGNPGVEGDQPDVEGGHPDVKGGHPGVEGGNHGVEGEHPGVEGGNPGVEGEHPDVEGGHPGVEGGQCDVEGGHPDVEGGHPGVEGGHPGVEGEHPAVERQFSWQYNIQFAIPQLSMSDGELQSGPDRHSLSSDSTVSENEPHDSVADFVEETLAQMNASEEVNVKTMPRKTSSKPTTPRHKPQATCSSTTKDSENTSQQNGDISNEPEQTSASMLSLDSQNDLMTESEQDCSVLETPNHYCSARQAQSKSKARKKLRESLKSDSITCRTGQQQQLGEEGLGESPQIRRVKQTGSVASSNSSECDCEKDCTCAGSETSSYNSETNDEEEIALAIQAAELASRNEARSRFRSSSDMIHRLFVCIAGVADQLQTNYASDLRHILKCVFELNSTNVPEDEPADGSPEEEEAEEDENGPTSNGPVTQGQNRVEVTSSPSRRTATPTPSRRIFDVPPEWVPDEQVERCTACKTPFTFMRRRHHCRNCGKIFCGKCSSTAVPLPQFGHQKPVRVCHRCFLYQVTHFTVSS